MPTTDRLALCRQAPAPPLRAAAGYLISFALAIVVSSLPIALAGRMLGDYFANWLAFTLFAIGAVILCIYLAWAREATSVSLSAAFSPICLSLFAVLLGKPYIVIVIAFFALLFVAAVLSLLIAYEYVAYLSADVLIPRKKRRRWRMMSRLQTMSLGFAWPLLLLAGTLTLLLFFCIDRFGWHPPAYGEAAYFFAFWLPFWLLLIAAVVFAAAYGRSRSFQPLLFLKACAHWLTYFAHPFAPGVHRPRGIWRHWTIRSFVVLIVVGLVTVTLLPSAYYFPFSLSRSERWAATISLPEAVLDLVQTPQPNELQHYPGYDSIDFNFVPPTTEAEYQEKAKQLMQLRKLTELQYDMLDFRLDHRRWSEARLAAKEKLSVASSAQENAGQSFRNQEKMFVDLADKPEPLSAKRQRRPRDLRVQQNGRRFWEDMPQTENAATTEPKSFYDSDWSNPASFAGISDKGRSAEAAAFVTEPQPESWLLLALHGLGGEDRVFFIWTFAAAFMGLLFVPLLLLFLCGSIATAPLLTAAAKDLVLDDTVDQSPGAVWKATVQTMQRSRNDVERESIYLGTHEWGDYPVMLPRKALREHAHIMGDTGSGKTALGLAPMISQLIGLTARDKRDAERIRSNGDSPLQQSSIVVIDLKGDPALFHGVRADAEKAGLPFKWFTNGFNKSTHVFNPFTQSHMHELSYDQRSQVIIEALGLNYGGEYGPSYYAGQNRQVMTRALNSFKESLQSFAQLYYVCQHGNRTATGDKFRLTPQHYKDAAHFLATVEALAKVPALNITATAPEHKEYATAAANQIDMADVVRNPQVVYFYLTSGIETSTVRDMAKLALFSLLTAAVQKPDAEVGDHQTYVFIDEFQQIVSTNLEIILRQARSRGLAAILSNQTINDLKGHGIDLIPTVQANTRIKQFFASSDLMQRDQLVDASGATIHYMADTLEVDGVERPYFDKPRITVNDVIRMTDDPSLSIVQLSRGMDFAKFKGFPFFLRSAYHISSEEYRNREKTPWPEQTAETITATLGIVDKISSIRPSVVTQFAGDPEEVQPETVSSMQTDEMFRRLHQEEPGQEPQSQQIQQPQQPQAPTAPDLQDRLNKAARRSNRKTE